MPVSTLFGRPPAADYDDGAQRSCFVDRGDVIPCTIGNFCPNRCSHETYKELPLPIMGKREEFRRRNSSAGTAGHRSRHQALASARLNKSKTASDPIRVSQSTTAFLLSSLAYAFVASYIEV
jgi:hypothetical protein